MRRKYIVVVRSIRSPGIVLVRRFWKKGSADIFAGGFPRSMVERIEP